ncbi:MAG: hypothetical protein M1814_004899 [Vezdaea aestivalis]|nr:MAG: hypothetical protein M1814_004899 [Vezdaea aestivalis]
MTTSTTRTTQALSITSTLLLAGTNLSSSYLTIPSLYPLPPRHSAPFFHAIYLKGAISLVPLGFFSGACSAAAAYLVPEQRLLWVGAAVATLAQTPWTLAFMMGTNNRLVAIAKGGERVWEKDGTKEEVEVLLRKWSGMNFVRGGLALVGGAIGLFAVLEG